jgi:Protein of unknown function (DUF3987)
MQQTTDREPLGLQEGSATPQILDHVAARKLDLLVDNPQVADADPFDEVLAPEHAAAISEISRAYSVPAGVPGCAFLSLAGACIGRTRGIAIKPGWEEHANMWIVLVGESGTGKSPATQEIQRPIFDLENKWYQDFKESEKEHQFELEQRRYLSKSERKVLEAPPEPPVWKQLIVDDSTTEALGSAFSGNPRGILWNRDELAGLILDMDKYSKNGGTKQRLMSAYDSGPWKTNRVSKQNFIRRACLSIFGTIQPRAMPAIFSDMDAATGFLPRFTFVKVEQEKPALWTDEVVSDRTKEILKNTYDRLLNFDFGDEGQPEIVKVSREAKETFIVWFDEQAREPWRAAEAGVYQAVLAKLKGQCLRVALILHCLDAVVEGHSELVPIQEGTMRRAIVLANFFKANQKAIWSQVIRRKQALNLNPLQKRVARAVVALESEIKDGMLPTAKIMKLANGNILSYEKELSEKSVGRILAGLGFFMKHLPGRSDRGPVVQAELVEKLKLSLNSNGLNGLNGSRPMMTGVSGDDTNGCQTV